MTLGPRVSASLSEEWEPVMSLSHLWPEVFGDSPLFWTLGLCYLLLTEPPWLPIAPQDCTLPSGTLAFLDLCLSLSHDCPKLSLSSSCFSHWDAVFLFVSCTRNAFILLSGGFYSSIKVKATPPGSKSFLIPDLPLASSCLGFPAKTPCLS